MENPYESPRSQGPQAGKSKIWKWVLWGCGGCLMTSVLLLGSCYFIARGAMKVGESQFGPSCDAYLAQANAGNYDAAYEAFDDSLKQAVPREKHRAMLKAIYGKLGKLKSKQVQHVQTGFDTTGTWVKIEYTAQFEHGEATLRFGLKKRGDQYKIVEFNYHSPVLVDLMIGEK